MIIGSFLQKLNPIYYVKPDGSVDPNREKRNVETSSVISITKVFNGYFGKTLNMWHSLVAIAI